MTDRMLDNEVGRMQGLLEGLDKKIDDIKKDIIHIKNNDKDKLERIAKIEKELIVLEKWREGHIDANKQARTDSQKAITELKKEFEDFKKEEMIWRIGMIVTFALVILELIKVFFT